jgi:predicted pyridoxine 5'-phosphate oxidase superfamily flavin-nucleotide-binding protein
MHAEAGLDCSHRGGNPGFVRATGPDTITFPDYAGNNMFQTLGNLELDSRAGLLFIDFETGSTLQLTGRATVHWDKERLTSWPGAQRVIEFQLERIQETAQALPLRWRLLDYSPFNP